MNFPKIKKMLVKYGVSEQLADTFISDLQAEPDDEVVEGDGVAQPNNPEPVEDTPAPEKPTEPDGDELGGEVAEEPTHTEPDGDEPVGDTTPNPEVEPTQPSNEPDKYVELENQVKELKAANEGLVAKIDSLVESLKNSGALTVVDETQPAGVDNQLPVEDSKLGNDVMAKFLNKANGRR